MKRALFVLAFALVMATTMASMAGQAFAQGLCDPGELHPQGPPFIIRSEEPGQPVVVHDCVSLPSR